VATSLLVVLGLAGTAGGVSVRVGVGANASEFAALHDQVLVALRLAVEEALEDLADAVAVARLGGERGATDVRSHRVVRHCAPRVVLGRRLREPDVASVACDLAALEGVADVVAVGKLAASRVDDVGATLEQLEGVLVEHVLRLRVEWAVERENIEVRVHVLRGLVVGQVELLLHFGGKAVAIAVVQLHIKRVHAAQDSKANATGGDRAEVHALHVVRALDAVGDVPAAIHDRLVGRDVVAHQGENACRRAQRPRWSCRKSPQ